GRVEWRRGRRRPCGPARRGSSSGSCRSPRPGRRRSRSSPGRGGWARSSWSKAASRTSRPGGGCCRRWPRCWRSPSTGGGSPPRGARRGRRANGAFDAGGLRRSDTVKTAVLRAVSHDLRSPLTAIRAASDGLEDETLTLTDDDRRELLDTISVEVRRLEGVVDNLLALSRLQAGAL